MISQTDLNDASDLQHGQGEAAPSVRRLQIAASLFAFAYRVKRHQLAKTHPEFDGATLHNETMRLIDAAARR